MREIARRAQVALSTVSVVLNRTRDVPVADETREAVLKVARELGYAQHALARAIRSPLRHVGIAVGDEQEAYETFTSVIFQGAATHLLARGYLPVILPVGRYESETKADTLSVPAKVIELFQSRLVDGLILDKPSFLDAEVRGIANAGVPMVVVNTGVGLKDAQGRVVPTVTIDDRLGGRLAAERLLQLGHKKIAVITRPYTLGPRAHHSAPVLEMRIGCEEAIEAAGLKPDAALLCEGDPIDPAITFDAVRRLLALSASRRPTALIVGDSQMAIMACNAVRDLGKRVPEDVSIIAYGDADLASRLSHPPLTIVRAPLRENGQAAAATLTSLLEDQPVPHPSQVLAPTLREGDSARAIR